MTGWRDRMGEVGPVLSLACVFSGALAAGFMQAGRLEWAVWPAGAAAALVGVGLAGRAWRRVRG